jgi:hypothetical protein
MDWVITVPKTTKWEEYMKEVESVAGGGYLNYRLSRTSKIKVMDGDRCFVAWDGQVRGWMKVVGVYFKMGFVCEVTKRRWPSGQYLVRAGKWHPVEDGHPMKGFRGIRRYRGAPPVD